jgi:hypothetical protein
MYCKIHVLKNKVLPLSALHCGIPRQTIRARGRLVARHVRHVAWQGQVVLRQWATKQKHVAARCLHRGALGKFYIRPFGPRSVCVEWGIPAIELSGRGFAAAGEPVFKHLALAGPRVGGAGAAPDPDPTTVVASSGSFHADLRSAWMDRHKMYEHAKMPKLGYIKPSAKTSSLCRLCGHSVG